MIEIRAKFRMGFGCRMITSFGVREDAIALVPENAMELEIKYLDSKFGSKVKSGSVPNVLLDTGSNSLKYKLM